MNTHKSSVETLWTCHFPFAPLPEIDYLNCKGYPFDQWNINFCNVVVLQMFHENATHFLNMGTVVCEGLNTIYTTQKSNNQLSTMAIMGLQTQFTNLFNFVLLSDRNGAWHSVTWHPQDAVIRSRDRKLTEFSFPNDCDQDFWVNRDGPTKFRKWHYLHQLLSFLQNWICAVFLIIGHQALEMVPWDLQGAKTTEFFTNDGKETKNQGTWRYHHQWTLTVLALILTPRNPITTINQVSGFTNELITAHIKEQPKNALPKNVV